MSADPKTAYRPGAVTDPSCPTCKAKLGDHHASTCSAGWGQVLPSECACDAGGPCLEHEPEEPNTDHVVLDYQTSKICCGHCGAEEAVVMPISVSVLVERTDAFLEQHGSCQAKTSKESP